MTRNQRRAKAKARQLELAEAQAEAFRFNAEAKAERKRIERLWAETPSETSRCSAKGSFIRTYEKTGTIQSRAGKRKFFAGPAKELPPCKALPQSALGGPRKPRSK